MFSGSELTASQPGDAPTVVDVLSSSDDGLSGDDSESLLDATGDPADGSMGAAHPPVLLGAAMRNPSPLVQRLADPGLVAEAEMMRRAALDLWDGGKSAGNGCGKGGGANGQSCETSGSGSVDGVVAGENGTRSLHDRRAREHSSTERSSAACKHSPLVDAAAPALDGQTDPSSNAAREHKSAERLVFHWLAPRLEV